MRLHVVSLPHTQTTKEYSWCAYTEKVRKFCNMMTDEGHHVVLYASEENEARVSELVTCISKSEQPEGIPEFSPDSPLFYSFNDTVIKEMAFRITPGDIICIIGGRAQEAIARAYPRNFPVEFGIGYSGTFSNYRIFESYAWMHAIYGAQAGDAAAADGKFFDDVIPNYFEIEDFPEHNQDDDYLLFVGRLIDRKGYHLAAEIAEAAGLPLKIAGAGQPPEYGDYYGVVGPEQRGRLMAGARAIIVPTLYLEPFGGVHVEAQLCGTPVISTDWGIFTETITNGVNGFRCRMFSEFVEAVEKTKDLDHATIRKAAQLRYSTQTVAKQYTDYFNRLMTLNDKGFYQ
jgi:glycosyltransferase involved in cell wall biosynthesis